MKTNKLYDTYPLSHALGSFLRAMEPAWQNEEDTENCSSSSCQSPDYRVENEDEHYSVSFLLPGFEKEDITLGIEEAQITIKANRGEAGKVNPFAEVSYAKTLPIPDSCDRAKVSAKLEAGILKVVLPKIKKPQAVKVKIS